MASFFYYSRLFSLRCTVFYFLISFAQLTSSLSTIAIYETSNQTRICALITSSNQQPYLNCSNSTLPYGNQIPSNSQTWSISGIVAGDGFLCFSSSSSSPEISTMMCWRYATNGTVDYKRIYQGPRLNELDAGNTRTCGIVNDNNNNLECWPRRGFITSLASNFSSLAVGENFVCGLSSIGNITCLGNDARVVGSEPRGNYSFLAAGFRHGCAISMNGSLDCWGEMVGQNQKPQGEFTSLALGESRSCALRTNGTIACWGKNNFSLPGNLQSLKFITIEAKRNIFCGIVLSNYSMFCWGNEFVQSNSVVFENVLPGPCRNESQCLQGVLPGSGNLCNKLGYAVCSPWKEPLVASLPPVDTSKQSTWNGKMVAFLVVGCIGSLSLIIVICIVVFWYCKGGGIRVHDSGPLDDVENGEQTNQRQGSQLPVQSQRQGSQLPGSTQPVLEKRLSHLISMGNGANLEEFSLEILLQATNNFSEDHKIGSGSFGSVYHATLDDGRELAIKRAELPASSYASGTKRFQDDKDNAFLNELDFLSRLNHKNLVRLLGFCEDSNEMVLVYVYMSNGNLHDHLHKLQNSPLISWVARLKVALDAARGIEYLHFYAVPPVIHRDIKCSNILLDANWMAKVSDFGLSLMGPSDDSTHLSLGAAGTVGYMDPEYYRFEQLTTKSDVYSFGIVLLELLSGIKAIHKNENGVPVNVVDVVVPYIVQDEIHKILDPKVPLPTPSEIEAVAYVAYLAADCVTLEGRDRPSMTEIVDSLERALAACLATPSPSRSSTRSST